MTSTTNTIPTLSGGTLETASEFAAESLEATA